MAWSREEIESAITATAHHLGYSQLTTHQRLVLHSIRTFFMWHFNLRIPLCHKTVQESPKPSLPRAGYLIVQTSAKVNVSRESSTSAYFIQGCIYWFVLYMALIDHRVPPWPQLCVVYYIHACCTLICIIGRVQATKTA